ncbi:hypothetical protein AVEN_46579-1 [Araneus ventricosus]|uniref:Uncharacterized protein n=1 Tax=Araneus ventricosus TaxID=182803 RepID=A0A4Y2MKU1_ARAVE|nr:hypothetical protein AVEN_46579-1 [Araneus ventricosus]
MSAGVVHAMSGSLEAALSLWSKRHFQNSPYKDWLCRRWIQLQLSSILGRFLFLGSEESYFGISAMAAFVLLSTVLKNLVASFLK